MQASHPTGPSPFASLFNADATSLLGLAFVSAVAIGAVLACCPSRRKKRPPRPRAAKPRRLRVVALLIAGAAALYLLAPHLHTLASDKLLYSWDAALQHPHVKLASEHASSALETSQAAIAAAAAAVAEQGRWARDHPRVHEAAAYGKEAMGQAATAVAESWRWARDHPRVHEAAAYGKEAMGQAATSVAESWRWAVNHPRVHETAAYGKEAMGNGTAAMAEWWRGVTEHPRVQEAVAYAKKAMGPVATSVAEGWRWAIAHPRVQAAAVYAKEAMGQVATSVAEGWETACAHPRVGAAIGRARDLANHSSVRRVLSHPQVEKALGHPLLWPAVNTAAAVAVVLLLRCSCKRGGKRKKAARPPPNKGGGEGKARQHKVGKPQKKGGEGRLRGVGEAELREEPPPPSAWDAARPFLLPFFAVRAVVRAVGSLFKGTEANPPLKARKMAKRAKDGSVYEEEETHGEAATHGQTHGQMHGVHLKKKAKEPAFHHPRLLSTLKGCSEPIASAALSQDGTIAAAVAADDRMLRVFTGLQQSGTPLPPPLLANLPLDNGSALSISANGRNIIVALEASRRLLAYAITPPNAKGKAGLTLKKEFPPKGGAHTDVVCAALLAPNSKFIVTAGSGEDLSVKLWSLQGDLIATATNKQLIQYGASISADSKFIAVAADSALPSRSVSPRHGQVTLFEVHYDVKGNPYKLTQAMCVGGHTRGISAVSFASDCVHLALASRDKEWSVWRTDVRYDLQAQPEEHARGAVPAGHLECIALSPFATRLVGGAGSEIFLFNVAAAARGKKACLLERIESGHGRVRTLSYSSDGMQALSGGEDGKLRLWRLEDQEQKSGTL